MKIGECVTDGKYLHIRGILRGRGKLSGVLTAVYSVVTPSALRNKRSIGRVEPRFLILLILSDSHFQIQATQNC
jgi:hypothetical protein